MKKICYTLTILSLVTACGFDLSADKKMSVPVPSATSAKTGSTPPPILSPQSGKLVQPSYQALPRVVPKSVQELILSPLPEHTMLAHGGTIIDNSGLFASNGSQGKTGPWVIGPALPLTKGMYRAEIQLRGENLDPEALASTIQVQLLPAKEEGFILILASRVIFGDELTKGNQSFILDFALPKDGQVILAINDGGNGILKLAQRSLKPLDDQADLRRAAAGLPKVEIEIETPNPLPSASPVQTAPLPDIS